MRWTVAADNPICLAKRRALQWVAALGLRSVALITACSLPAVIPRTAGPRLGAQPVESRAAIAPPPQTDRGLGHPKPRRQHADTLARRAAQHDPRSHRQRLRDTLRPQPAPQLGSICSAYLHPAALYAHAE